MLVDHLIHKALEEVAPMASGRLVDIGCGTKPYAPVFAPYVSAHLGVDQAESIHGTGAVDLIGSAYEIPLPDGSVDTVLSTSVIEHLEEPARSLAEARRVLTDGGLAIYTAPLIWHLHEQPRDFFRYTSFGLKHLFEANGFEIVEIRPLSGFWVTVGQLFVYYLYRFNRGPMRLVPVIPLIGLLVQALSLGLDRLDRATDWTWMYLVLARARTAPSRPAEGR